jgi:hypothetical protein
MVRMGRRFDSGGGATTNQQLRPGPAPGLFHAWNASNRHLPEICQKTPSVVVRCSRAPPGSSPHAPAASPPGSCPRDGGQRGPVSPSGCAGSRRHQVRASPFSPAVPLACHSQRSRPVPSRQPRTTSKPPRPPLSSVCAGGGPARSGFGTRSRHQLTPRRLLNGRGSVDPLDRVDPVDRLGWRGPAARAPRATGRRPPRWGPYPLVVRTWT